MASRDLACNGALGASDELLGEGEFDLGVVGRLQLSASSSEEMGMTSGGSLES